ncbi:hypothetical protein GBA52_025910 [Prunus armeniaca]|nr:hypothetical protein GBA52_025910 [Prunus armeniaca]
MPFACAVAADKAKRVRSLIERRVVANCPSLFWSNFYPSLGFQFFPQRLQYMHTEVYTYMSRFLCNSSIQAWKRCMSLAQGCSNMRKLKATHAIFITYGLHLNNYAISKLIAFCALSNSGDLAYASLLFNQIQTPNSYIYNTLIRANSRSSQPHLAVHYFLLMLKQSSLGPDNYTFNFVILACANCSG